MIASFKNQQETIEKCTCELIKSEQNLQAKVGVLTSLEGVGLITAAVLMAELPELGKIDKRATSKLAGVAPFSKQSGLRNTRREHMWSGKLCAKRSL